jgi:hypothetical protein
VAIISGLFLAQRRALVHADSHQSNQRALAVAMGGDVEGCGKNFAILAA